MSDELNKTAQKKIQSLQAQLDEARNAMSSQKGGKGTGKGEKKDEEDAAPAGVAAAEREEEEEYEDDDEPYEESQSECCEECE